ncbi:Hpt domain-containing protein [Stenotrophomonas sp.]|uniref:hybrid sensor histidine kinase/response regulator n=1 Tax=Stenotrophomonas sp. TaxID=69392 RepID=UPI0028ACD7FE|nr:Hpt domain-containing protein [Stenotrophomonas sp.]
MSTLRDAMSHAALGWVKPELDETLRQVRNEVEQFVEDPSDTSRMRFCAGYLHQVQGTLRMVELYAPAMVAEELELLANAVRDGAVPEREEACATLMRGTVLLPDYLERLQNGHRDIPIVLLPLLNEIRAARGAEGINESVLFAFNPDASDASPAELEHARGSLRGRNRELLDTVGNAVKEDLMRIKDALDLHVRTGGNAADLQTQVDELRAVSDTLGVMGLGVARGIVAKQRDALAEVVAGNRGIDDNLLLDIAGSLLYVDASLDDQVAHLGANAEGEDDAAAVETRRTVEVLAHEAIANFTAARESFVAFIETNWDHERLAEVPRLLGEVAGALRMLELPQPADYLLAVRQYIESELIGRRRIPGGRQLDTLADAMASLEYYLEALRDRRSGREDILDITRSSLEALHYWPIPALTVDAPAGMAAAVTMDAPAVAEAAPAAAEPPVETPRWDLEPVQETPAIVEEAAPQAEPSVQEPVAAVVPPPLPEIAPAAATPTPAYPLLFGAAIHAKPTLNELPPVPNVAGPFEVPAEPAVTADASVFDPVAAEYTQPVGNDDVVAPIVLEERDDAPATDIAPTAFQAFDPVASEEVAPEAAASTVFTFDSSLLELDDASSRVEPAAVQDVTVADGFFAPELDEAVTLEAASPAEPAEPAAIDAPVDWQLEEAPLLEHPTEAVHAAAPVAPAEEPSVVVAQQVPEAVEVADAEAAAFMAELNAAADAFDPFARPAAPEPARVPELVEAAAAAAPAARAPVSFATLDGGFIDGGDDIDQDIRDVFIEEFDEELVNLGHLLTAWRAAPGNMERLRPVRRVFHTLKGSGRLVGARTLGEFSWKIEGMLNRVLDGSRPASPAVVAMVNQAYDVLPELNAALRGAGSLHSDLLGMQDVADRVAAGEEAFYQTPSAAPAPAPAPVAEAIMAEPMAVAAVEAEGTPASVDSVLREILEAEVSVHLETVNRWLAQSNAAPQPVNEDLLRAVHTMSGAFAMTDVPVITSITSPAESFVKRSLAAGIVPGAVGVQALSQMAAAIDTTINALRDPAPRIPAFPGVAERLQALVDALPDAKWPPMPVEDELSLDDADPAPVEEAGAVEPSAPELSMAEDLSAYLDASLLEGTPGAAPVQDVQAPPLAGAAAGTVPTDAGQAIESPVDLSSAEAEMAVEPTTTTDAVAAALNVVDAADTAQQDSHADVDEAAQRAPIDEAPVAFADDVRQAPAEAAEASSTQEVVESPAASGTSSPFAWLATAGAAVAGVAAAAFRKDTAAEEVVPAREANALEPSVPDEATPSEFEAPSVQDADLVADADADADADVQVAEIAAQVDEVEDLSAELAPLADSETVPASEAALQDVDAEGAVAAGNDVDALPEAVVVDVEETASDVAATDAAVDEATAGVEDADVSAPSEMRLEDTGNVAEDAPLEDAAAEAAVAPVLEDAAVDVPVAVVVERDDAATAGAEVAIDPVVDAEEIDTLAADVAGQGDEITEPAEPVADVPVDVPGTAARIELAPLTAPLPEDQPVVVSEPVLAELVVGPLDFNELDRELVDIFVEEGKDLLDHCDGLLHELRSTPEDREALAGLQRDLHTLKGGARMAGINAIGDLGHGIESLLEAVAANRTEMTRGDVTLLERGFDRLHQLLVHTGDHHAVQMPLDLIGAFEARTDGRAEAAPAPVEAPALDASAPMPVTDEVQPQPLTAAVPLSAPVIDEQAAEEDGAPRGQEQVRVRADLLDSLVNHAGEVAIYRSRLEQQLGAFRGAMAELDRTNARLRDQLRRLDLETEAQIVARYRREHEQVDQTFDPLELDRFSTLQQLSRALNESAADLGGLQGVLDELSRNYDTLLQQQSRVSSELQDGLMRARMVPFDGLVPRLRRVVRQAAHDTGKQVHLKLEGTHGELDRNVLDRMVAPLEHMLRNSVAHGLEEPAARARAGKVEEGEIALRLRREGSEIVLEVADDGAGLDRAAIRRRAEQRGLLGAEEQIDDSQLDQMIFASGFSTSEQVSQLAGRGVGMDVVRNEVRQLGGSVDIHSERGHGATFTLRLPQTLAVTQAVFVRIGETTYAVPVASVSGIGRISRERFESGQSGYHYNGEDFTLYNLGTLVGQAAAKAEGQNEIPLLLVRSGDLRAAVAIDQVLGNREIVVKPVGLQIASVPGIYGATITGEGNVVVILDVAPLVRRHLAQPQQAVEATVVTSQRHAPLVMVVDDSLTMRKVTGRVLERHNFEVAAARDGVEALELLEERVPDLMLLDIEMPRMDGYELATAMRADPRYKDVPIVMITSRSGDKHRQRAFEIGVQRYLGKPYQELDLMRNVYDLLGIARVRE